MSAAKRPEQRNWLPVQTSDNPFKLRYVTEVRTPGKLDDMGPCVVLATPSMLQSGLSRELFDSWCEDARNGIIICDFAVQGTLAREIQGTPSHVITKAGAKVSLHWLHQAASSPRWACR